MNASLSRFFILRVLCILKLFPRWLRLSTLSLLLLFASFLNGNAQPPIDYAVHANIIYHFTKYIDWPNDRKSGDFVIGVIGNMPLEKELKKISAYKTAGNRKIVVERFSASQSSYDCHILFVGESEKASIEIIAARTSNQATLLVSELQDGAQRGASINFLLVSERLKLEININNIKHRHLNIANELVRLGTVVK